VHYPWGRARGVELPARSRGGRENGQPAPDSPWYHRLEYLWVSYRPWLGGSRCRYQHPGCLIRVRQREKDAGRNSSK
jgi:hypothetical protein